MANITTGSTVTVTKMLDGVGYSEGEFHLEVRQPDGTVKWFEGGEVTFTVSEASDDSATTISTSISLSSEGRWRISLYRGELGGSYTKLASTSIQKIVSTTIVEM